MEDSPTKRHSFLSANSLRLRQDDIYAFSRKNILLLAGGAILLILISVLIGVVAGRNSTPFANASVDESTYTYSVQFYKDATTQHSRNKKYLVARDANNKETSFWVSKLKAVLPCGSYPAFDYTASSEDIAIYDSCYKSDRSIYVSDVTVNGQVYQLNMTSQKPVSIQDAKTIFASVVIE